MPRFWLSINFGHSTVTIGEAASWPRQNRAGSSGVYKKFSLLSTTPRVIQGSTGVMRMDQVGSGAETGTQTPLVGVWKSLIQEVCKELGPVGVPPSAVPWRVLRTFGLPVPHFRQKSHTDSGPVSFLVVSLTFSSLQGPLKVVGESEQTKTAFSLLASFPYCPPPLS